VIVHVVEYNEDRPVIRSQAWYLYNGAWPDQPAAWQRLADPDIARHFARARIFGADRARVLYVYRNVQAMPEGDVVAAASRAAAANKTSADELLKNSLFDNSGRELVRLNRDLRVTTDFRILASLTYKVEVTGKQPHPLQNLLGALGVAQAGVAMTKLDRDAAPHDLCGSFAFPIARQPSDVKVTASGEKGGSPVLIGDKTYDNERRYPWDVSFALPLRSRQDLSVSADGSVSAKKVEKTDLFAVLNLSAVPFDTKRAQLNLVPRLLYGVPVTGKPLQHHLLALAVGLNRVQAFVGYRWDRREVVSTGTEGGVSTVTQAPAPAGTKWDRTLVWGLNLPVSTVKNTLGIK